MGWCSATEYVDSVWDSIKDYLPEDKKPEIARKIIKIFQAGDWDCEHDSSMVQEVIHHPEIFFLVNNIRWIHSEEQLNEITDHYDPNQQKILLEYYRENKSN